MHVTVSRYTQRSDVLYPVSAVLRCYPQASGVGTTHTLSPTTVYVCSGNMAISPALAAWPNYAAMQSISAGRYPSSHVAVTERTHE